MKLLPGYNNQSSDAGGLNKKSGKFIECEHDINMDSDKHECVLIKYDAQADEFGRIISKKNSFYSKYFIRMYGIESGFYSHMNKYLSKN